MISNLEKLKERKIKDIILYTVILTLIGCLVQTLWNVNDLVDKFGTQSEELTEARTKLFNTQLEKISFIKSEQKQMELIDDEDKKEYQQNIVNEFKNRFREVKYTYEKSKLSQMDFSELDISCDTYKEMVISRSKALYPDVKLINTNCDEK